MARPLRLEFPGAVYHITTRGNGGTVIFGDAGDRQDFCDLLGFVITRFNWLCHGYCLMDTHYHLIIETPDGNLSEGMRQLNGIYTQMFNRKHESHGHLFQGRYKAILVDKESYLLELCRYVVLNPLRAGISDNIGDWRWSSYPATAGFAESPAWLTTDWILGHFHQTRKRAAQAYVRFVAAGKTAITPWENLRGQIFLGGPSLGEMAQTRVDDVRKVKEIPRTQRLAGRPPLDELLPAGMDKSSRNRGIYQAHVEWGYRLIEIGEHLALHYTTVSRIVKGVELSG